LKTLIKEIDFRKIKRMENKPNKKSNEKQPKFNISWLYGLIIVILLGSYFFNGTETVKEVPYSSFQKYVNSGYIGDIDVYSAKNQIEADVQVKALNEVFGDKVDDYKKNPRISVRIPNVEKFSEFISDAQKDNKFQGAVEYKTSRDYMEIFLYSVLPFALLIGFFVFMSRRMSGQVGG